MRSVVVSMLAALVYVVAPPPFRAGTAIGMVVLMLGLIFEEVEAIRERLEREDKKS